MSKAESYPMPELLEKVAQVAVLHHDKRLSGLFVKVGVPDVSIKEMMKEGTFILPPAPDEVG